MSQDQIIERLKEGNKRFVEDKLESKLQDSARRQELVGDQQPDTIVLSCADSRVIPELAFDTGIGELFVVRVAGNVANSSSLASIEYAVANCGSSVIVVMGHQSCGAVGAAVKGGNNGFSINHLLSHLTPALVACGPDASVNDIVKKNAEMTAVELTKRSKIIYDAVKDGKVRIVAAYYSLETGEVIFS